MVKIRIWNRKENINANNNRYICVFTLCEKVPLEVIVADLNRKLIHGKKSENAFTNDRENLVFSNCVILNLLLINRCENESTKIVLYCLYLHLSCFKLLN